MGRRFLPWMATALAVIAGACSRSACSQPGDCPAGTTCAHGDCVPVASWESVADTGTHAPQPGANRGGGGAVGDTAAASGTEPGTDTAASDTHTATVTAGTETGSDTQTATPGADTDAVGWFPPQIDTEPPTGVDASACAVGDVTADNAVQVAAVAPVCIAGDVDLTAAPAAAVFPQLEWVAGNLVLDDPQRVPALRQVGGSLLVATEQTTLAGLELLRRVSGSLIIWYSRITSVGALLSLRTAAVLPQSQIAVVHNDDLPYCDLCTLFARLDAVVPDTYTHVQYNKLDACTIGSPFSYAEMRCPDAVLP